MPIILGLGLILLGAYLGILNFQACWVSLPFRQRSPRLKPHPDRRSRLFGTSFGDVESQGCLVSLPLGKCSPRLKSHRDAIYFRSRSHLFGSSFGYVEFPGLFSFNTI
jgi:hypothetical protein